jgi:2-oxoglutarate dehydrogenase E1 component
LLLKTDPLPLVVFTPKGFLRHPQAASRPSELAEGSWQPLIEDRLSRAKKRGIKQLILCSGRIYFDLAGSHLRSESENVAIVRIEQLYPFPHQTLEKMLKSFPALERVVWVQEEPFNMGAWQALGPRLRPMLGDHIQLIYVGRPESSSPAEGSSTLYQLNQQALIHRAYKIDEPAQSHSVLIERG